MLLYAPWTCVEGKSGEGGVAGEDSRPAFALSKGQAQFHRPNSETQTPITILAGLPAQRRF